MSDLLPNWLPQQRWFGAKGRQVESVDIVSDHTVVDGDPALRHLLVERLEHAVIGSEGPLALYDAAHDNELTQVLLQLIAEEADEGGLAFRKLPDVDLNVELTGLVMGAEQSNTSLVFGEDYILKLFRKVAPGVNPDLEITRALAQTECTAIAPPLGWIEMPWPTGHDEGEPTTLGLLQPFLRSASEGWQLAVTSIRDLYAEADLHADEVGGDFAGESERLGAATAEVHALMRQVLESRAADEAENTATAKQMRERLDAASEIVPQLAPLADGIRAAYDAVASLPPGVAIQRIHGDFHLGQVLRTDKGWVLIDFEGEPARPLAERQALMSPLRDVAGMLRSFDYAARHLLAEQRVNPGLEYRAGEWAERNREAFCLGYGRAVGRDPREDDVLLRAFELDKAVYEVVYEARHRPGWLAIPLGSIERLVR
jgi:maltokinase